jgi:putative FmdB family regulatory protein
MPVFEYRCTPCRNVYDIFHRGREIADDIICPSCGAREHTRLISAPAIAVGGSGKSFPEAPSCSAGNCCGGVCDQD